MPLRSRKSSKKHHIPLLLQDCQRLYNTTDLYKVIGACRDSTAREGQSWLSSYAVMFDLSTGHFLAAVNVVLFV